MRGLIFAFIFALPFATSAGCSLEDSLEDKPCKSDDDCLGSYTCVITPNASVGLCREDGTCLAGEQEGCVADEGSCNYLLTLVMDSATGVGYCCSTGGASNPTVSMADGTSARCIACPSDLCSQGEASEACSEGDSRCVVASDSSCGCRVPADEIANSECDDAASCGEGFVCTRTLEQEEEPDEALNENRAQEPGWCRPEDAPECAGGLQEGCRTDDTQGCPSAQTYSCTKDGRCYCCDDPSDGSNFSVHVYAETGSGESAACIECPRDCVSPNPYPCTLLEDASCMINSGECGCSAS